MISLECTLSCARCRRILVSMGWKRRGRVLIATLGSSNGCYRGSRWIARSQVGLSSGPPLVARVDIGGVQAGYFRGPFTPSVVLKLASQPHPVYDPFARGPDPRSYVRDWWPASRRPEFSECVVRQGSGIEEIRTEMFHRRVRTLKNRSCHRRPLLCYASM